MDKNGGWYMVIGKLKVHKV